MARRSYPDSVAEQTPGAFWRFEARDRMTEDWSGNGRGLGAVVAESLQDGATPNRNFGAVRFVGVADYAQVATSPYWSDWSQGAFSLSLWVRPDAYPTVSLATIFCHDSQADGYWLRLTGTGAVEIVVPLSGGPHYLQTSAVLPLGVWSHVAVTVGFSGGVTTARVYLGGAVAAELVYAEPPAPTPNHVPRLASRPDHNERFYGSLDEVALWKRALSATEVRAQWEGRRRITRASVFQGALWGREEAIGERAEPVHRLLPYTVTIVPVVPRSEIGGAGKAPVGNQGGKEYSEVAVSGVLSFNDLPFLLASRTCRPEKVPTADAGATELVFLPEPHDPDDRATYTIQGGNTAGAVEVTGATIRALEVSLARGGATVTASGVGQELTEIVRLATGADVPLQPVAIPTVDVRFAASLAGLDDAAARLRGVLAASVLLPEVSSPVLCLDSTEPSYSDVVETGSRPTARLTLIQDAQAASVFARLAASAPVYLRLSATGPVISGGVAYALRVTLPAFVTALAPGEQDGVYVGSYSLLLRTDVALASWCEWRLTVPTAVASLL
jgi:hypothetical protein